MSDKSNIEWTDSTWNPTVGVLMRAILNRIFSMESMSGDGACPVYLYRWTLLKVGSLFSVYLHKFVGDDWSIDLHDHPKRFWSIGLRGSYIEFRPHVHKLCPPTAFGDPCPRLHDWSIYCAPWIRTFPAEHKHRLVGPTPQEPCWTLVIVGRAVRQWGFWPHGSFVPWRKYVNEQGQSRRNC